MSDQVRSETRRAQAKWGWPAIAALAACAVLLAFVGLAATPYLFKGASLRSEVAEQVRTTTGLMLSVDGPVRFRLMPQPHVEMVDLHFVDGTGTLKVDADTLQGAVRLLPLLVGRLEISSATLDHPRLSIDLDGRPMPPDSTIGRALRANGAAPPAGNQRLGVVTLHDGTAVLKSKAHPQDIVINAINVTVDWRDLDAQATLTGTVGFNGVAADVAAWVAQPSSLLRGDHSAMTLRIQSEPLDFSANGDFATTPISSFHGRVTATAPTLAGALALAGYKPSLPAPCANLSLTSDATIGGGAIDLPSLRLRMDDNAFEGTLAYQAGGDRPALSGTLATEQLTLAPFFSKAPVLLDGDRHWSARKLKLDLNETLALDLRISATHLRLPPIAVTDAALAVMTRDDRTEIALVEGKAYGGALKGRMSVGVSDAGLSLRAAGSLNDADASALSWDAFGRQLAAGSLSVSANLEGAGDSVASLMNNLHGWTKGRASDGELSGVNLGLALRELAAQRYTGILPALHKGRTPFDTMLFSLQVADGVATIDDGLLKGADTVLTVDGKTDLGARALDLRATAAAPAGATVGATSPVGPRLPFDIKGTFDQPVVTPALGGALPPANPPAASP